MADGLYVPSDDGANTASRRESPLRLATGAESR